jgi:hypothetical protein
MTALARLSPIEELDDERHAAAQRLDDDLRAVARAVSSTAAATQGTLETLRRRCIATYRSALLGAAGIPDDRLWTLLSHAVSAFVAYAGEFEIRDPAGRAAKRRLGTLD